VQHAMRAFTARDRKALRLAAETYRENPAFDIEEAIRLVGVGEAVTSLLERKGVPGIAQRTLIRPPSSQLGPITPGERSDVMASSDLGARYDAAVNRRSAHEILRARAEQAAREAEAAELAEETQDMQAREFSAARRYSGKRVSRSTSRPVRSGKSFGEKMGDMVIKELTGTTGRRIVRGVLGGLFRGR